MTAAGALPLDHAGRAHETSLDPGYRHAAGVFYTPDDVATALTGLALERVPSGHETTVCDPACGAGAFLLAAATHLAGLGLDRRTIVGHLLFGADIDPDAVDIARRRLRSWAAEDGPGADAVHVVVGDPLVDGGAVWPDRPTAGFSAVVGNPPFQSQLAADTARGPARAAVVRGLLGAAAAAYTDSAALFLVLAARLVAPGGTATLIVPESFLSARDAGPARDALLGELHLDGLWSDGGEAVFDAAVRVCAPVLCRRASMGAGPGTGAVARWVGRGVKRVDPSGDPPEPIGDEPWSPLLASLRGVPDLGLTGPGTLADLAVATAGFRDQYYGVAPHVVEGAGTPREVPLVTAGLVDPARCRWGRSTTRFAGRRWHAPVVDLGALGRDDPVLASWADARLRPKLVVATQTRVVEAVADVEGRWWPSVPTIAVTPRSGAPSDLWPLLAVLLAPPVSAWALGRFGGAALSGDAIKLSARQVLAAPLPADPDAWAAGARCARQAHRAAARGDADAWRSGLEALGVAMAAAYGSTAEVLDWWLDRVPGWR